MFADDGEDGEPKTRIQEDVIRARDCRELKEVVPMAAMSSHGVQLSLS